MADEDGCFIQETLEADAQCRNVGTVLVTKNFALEKGVESRPIPVDDFVTTVENMAAHGDFGFEEEFNSLPMRYPYPKTVADAHPKDNRYEDISPYDHSRVALSPSEDFTEGDDGCGDYINASYFDENLYIGTQGPLPHTICDFWRMIWEQCTKVIVMVTNITENHTKKCERYWPEHVGEFENYGNFSVTLTNESMKPEFIVRSLRLVHTPTGYEVNIFQCHYIGWPDKGVPSCTYDVLDFVVYTRHLQNSLLDAGPIVVHCSAGVGRSGTYVVLDQCMQIIEAEPVIDIVGIVVSMRKARMYSVQTQSQYAFIFKGLRDFVTKKKSDLCRDSLDDYLSRIGVESYRQMSISKERKDVGKIAMEYEELAKDEEKMKRFLSNSSSNRISAHKKYNLAKNLDKQHISYEATRVVLKQIDGVAGTDYINASWVNGFETKCYCVCPSPIPYIFNDFWRMVYEYDLNTIVLIGDVEATYWPEKLESTTIYGDIEITFKEIEEKNWFCKRIFALHHIKSDTKRVITQHHFFTWKESETPAPSAMVAFFLVVRGKTPDCDESEKNRMVVQSRTCGQAGCFILLDMSCRSLYVFNHSNIFVYAKRIRFRRFGLIAHLNQYRFCYQGLAEFAKYLKVIQHPTPSYIIDDFEEERFEEDTGEPLWDDEIDSSFPHFSSVTHSYSQQLPIVKDMRKRSISMPHTRPRSHSVRGTFSLDRENPKLSPPRRNRTKSNARNYKIKDIDELQEVDCQLAQESYSDSTTGIDSRLSISTSSLDVFHNLTYRHKQSVSSGHISNSATYDSLVSSLNEHTNNKNSKNSRNSKHSKHSKTSNHHSNIHSNSKNNDNNCNHDNSCNTYNNMNNKSDNKNINFNTSTSSSSSHTDKSRIKMKSHSLPQSQQHQIHPSTSPLPSPPTTVIIATSQNHHAKTKPLKLQHKIKNRDSKSKDKDKDKDKNKEKDITNNNSNYSNARNSEIHHNENENDTSGDSEQCTTTFVTSATPAPGVFTGGGSATTTTNMLATPTGSSGTIKKKKSKTKSKKSKTKSLRDSSGGKEKKGNRLSSHFVNFKTYDSSRSSSSSNRNSMPAEVVHVIPDAAIEDVDEVGVLGSPLLNLSMNFKDVIEELKSANHSESESDIVPDNADAEAETADETSIDVPFTTTTAPLAASTAEQNTLVLKTGSVDDLLLSDISSKIVDSKSDDSKGSGKDAQKRSSLPIL